LDRWQNLSGKQLEEWSQQARSLTGQGKVVERIPRLAAANPNWFAVHLCLVNGQTFSLGNVDCRFPLMSVIKPFILLNLLEQWGLETVFQWVGMEPSETPFNSLEQLLADSGRPRNPMINSGAIALAEKLSGVNAADCCRRLCNWLNQLGQCGLELDEAVLASVRLAGRETNQAIAQALAEVGRLTNPTATLDTYEQICCLSATTKDLAQLGLLLADERGVLAAPHRQAVNAMMLTCGLYEASSLYAVRVGLPMKSGISGALLAIMPRQGAIACYSPALDAIGNPIAGLAFIEKLAQKLQLSLFA